MSFEILRIFSMTQRHEHGVNMGINQKFNIVKTKQRNLRMEWEPLDEQKQKNLIKFLSDCIKEINLKDKFFK